MLLSRTELGAPLWRVALAACGLGLGLLIAPNNSRMLGAAPPHLRASRRACAAIVPWALALSLVAGGPACNGGGGSGGSPPVLSNLQVYPPSAALNDGAGTVAASMSANVSDSGADVSRMVITVRDPSGAQVNKFSGDVTNPPGMTQGTIGGTFPLSTAAVTTFTLQFQVFDAGGSGSNILSATFPVVTGNPVPTLSSISPASAAAGGPGFTLTVTGADFMTASSVLWNGSYLTTTYVDATTLTARRETRAFPKRAGAAPRQQAVEEGAAARAGRPPRPVFRLSPRAAGGEVGRGGRTTRA